MRLNYRREESRRIAPARLHRAFVEHACGGGLFSIERRVDERPPIRFDTSELPCTSRRDREMIDEESVPRAIDRREREQRVSTRA
jgi:hypothetical protein